MPKTPGREAIDAIGGHKPFLDLQLKLYQDATESAATLATSMDPKILEENEARFWRLYWGVLAMVENGGIDSASGGVEVPRLSCGLVGRAGLESPSIL